MSGRSNTRIVKICSIESCSRHTRPDSEFCSTHRNEIFYLKYGLSETLSDIDRLSEFDRDEMMQAMVDHVSQEDLINERSAKGKILSETFAPSTDVSQMANDYWYGQMARDYVDRL